MSFLDSTVSKTGLVICAMLVAGTSSVLRAQQTTPLPDPLTLDYALSLADDPHPELLLQDARIQSALAEHERAENNAGFDVYLDLGVQEMDNDRTSIQRQDHARAGLVVSKTLYDFGRTSKLSDSARQLVESEQLTFLDTRARRRLEILQAYFDVLLADLNFNHQNEAMAIAFIAADRLRDRRELGQASDLQVVEEEANYERVRGLRYRSENQQRETRARLAAAINRPDNLPANLVIPKLDVLSRKLPEIEELQNLALTNNYVLQSRRKRVTAAEESLSAARANYRPVLRGLLEAYEYDTDTGSSDEVRAEIALQVPLYQAGQSANVSRELARLYAERAQLEKAEVALRQAVLDLWHRIEELRIKRDESAKLLEFRELHLERSRALYEMEVRADLGDAMVKLTEAQYLSARNDYQLALAWHQMDILTGQLQLEPVQQSFNNQKISQE